MTPPRVFDLEAIAFLQLEGTASLACVHSSIVAGPDFSFSARLEMICAMEVYPAATGHNGCCVAKPLQIMFSQSLDSPLLVLPSMPDYQAPAFAEMGLTANLQGTFSTLVMHFAETALRRTASYYLGRMLISSLCGSTEFRLMVARWPSLPGFAIE